jgi:hypothetical protein
VDRACRAIGTIAAVAAVSACGSGATTLSTRQQDRLPLEVGALNALCTDLPSEWESPAYQALRMRELRRAESLVQAVRDHPDNTVDAYFNDADSGRKVDQAMTVRELAHQQLEEYRIAGYCESSATPREGRTQGRRVLGALQAALRRG